MSVKGWSRKSSFNGAGFGLRPLILCIHSFYLGMKYEILLLLQCRHGPKNVKVYLPTSPLLDFRNNPLLILIRLLEVPAFSGGCI